MMVKLLFYKGRKSENPQSQFLDRLICFMTNSMFSHVELVEHDFSNGIYNTWSCSPRDKSVRNASINTNNGSWVLREIDGDLEASIKWFKEHRGAKYNWLGLIGVYLNIHLTNGSGTYFCSEAIANCLGFSNPWSFDPEELFKLSHELN